MISASLKLKKTFTSAIILHIDIETAFTRGSLVTDVGNGKGGDVGEQAIEEGMDTNRL
jgi:hypothetical protein